MKPGVVAMCILIARANLPRKQLRTVTTSKEACQFAVRGPENELELSKASFCKGFVKTIVSIGRRLNKPDSFCAPDGVTVGQAINVFLKYLNDNPDKAQQAAADGIWDGMALQKAVWEEASPFKRISDSPESWMPSKLKRPRL